MRKVLLVLAVTLSMFNCSKDELSEPVVGTNIISRYGVVFESDNCYFGEGVIEYTGVDLNSNGILDASETDSEIELCTIEPVLGVGSLAVGMFQDTLVRYHEPSGGIRPNYTSTMRSQYNSSNGEVEIKVQLASIGTVYLKVLSQTSSEDGIIYTLAEVGSSDVFATYTTEFRLDSEGNKTSRFLVVKEGLSQFWNNATYYAVDMININ